MIILISTILLINVHVNNSYYPEILREDRVIIKNKIKHGDIEALRLFINLKKPISK
jgi:hypothetical protein